MLVKKQKIESQNWKFEFFVNKVVFSFASNAKMLEVFRKNSNKRYDGVRF